VLAALLELEVAGRVTRHHGNRICLVIDRWHQWHRRRRAL